MFWYRLVNFAVWGIIFAAAVKLRFASNRLPATTKRKSRILPKIPQPPTDSTPLPDVSLFHARGMGNPTKEKHLIWDLEWLVTNSMSPLAHSCHTAAACESSEGTKEGFLLSRRPMPPQTRPEAEAPERSFDTYPEDLRSYPGRESPPRLLGE